MPEGGHLWLTYALGLIILVMLLRVLYLPLRFLLKILYQLVAGGIALWLLNLAGGLIGYQLALNPLTALTVGYLGVPGVALLVILQQLVA